MDGCFTCVYVIYIHTYINTCMHACIFYRSSRSFGLDYFNIHASATIVIAVMLNTS